MMQSSVGLVLLFNVLLVFSEASSSKVRGLDPALYDRYTNQSGKFKCLDGSATIPFSSVNDDYCDCPDGSDEPGTAACEGVGDGWFWCENKGHIPGRVKRSRVNDGLCDAECCDGSDEWATGACSDRCEEIGRQYREEQESLMKTRKTGSKIRSTYVKFAQSERTRLETEIKVKTIELKNKEIEVENARVNLERTEASSKEALERKKSQPLYIHTLSQKLALTRLRAKTARLEHEIADLHNILEELSKNYNPNYSDMAVKAAVKGFEELTKGVEIEEGSEEDVKPDVDEVEEEIGDKELDELDRKDLEGLVLLEEDDLVFDDENSLLFRIEEYIPDSLYEYWESARDLAIDWMVKLGLVKGSHTSSSSSEAPHVSAARDRHRNLSNELNKLRNDIGAAENTITKMHLFYGPDGEWKKLENTCVDKVSGDYTYEFCFFGRATQRSNKDSSSNHLGTFSHWKTDEEEGSFAYYTMQNYENGAKCWNGPQRSARVKLSCGTTNALLSISEPEKCEYLFTATSPALCWPLEPKETAAGASPADDSVKNEL